MKFMILTYASQQDYDEMAGKPGDRPAWSAEDFAAMGAFMHEFNSELAESGELVETRGLSAPVHARRVQQREGAPVVTDGPYAESQEVLAGYWVVECESFDRATEIVARLSACPSPEHGRVRAFADVRPIDEHRPDRASDPRAVRAAAGPRRESGGATQPRLRPGHGSRPWSGPGRDLPRFAGHFSALRASHSRLLSLSRGSSPPASPLRSCFHRVTGISTAAALTRSARTPGPSPTPARRGSAGRRGLARRRSPSGMRPEAWFRISSFARLI